MIKVVTTPNNWIKILGHSGTTLWEGHQPNAIDLTEILNIVSRDGCELIQTTEEELG